jgi:MFS family permease
MAREMTTSPAPPGERWVTTNIPARLDRLPWSGWHTLVVTALGITWLLDGLEANMASALAGALKRPDTLALTDADLGLSGSVYLLGCVAGALVFGYATDLRGRTPRRP